MLIYNKSIKLIDTSERKHYSLTTSRKVYFRHYEHDSWNKFVNIKLKKRLFYLFFFKDEEDLMRMIIINKFQLIISLTKYKKKIMKKLKKCVKIQLK